MTTQTGIKLAIFGPYGVGKTSLLKTLDEPTLCLDFEAGLLSVRDWDGDSIAIRNWEDAQDVACLLGGPNKFFKMTKAYSEDHYKRVKAKYPSFDAKKYSCIFIDSITIASKLCLIWCKSLPDVETRAGPDMRRAYGHLAIEMGFFLDQFHYIRDKDVVFVGLLEKKTDEMGYTSYAPQVDGNKVANDIPAILDEIITMVGVSNPKDKTAMERKFVCQTMNPKGYPAKDRSGKLNMEEEPHLGNLLKKLKGEN